MVQKARRPARQEFRYDPLPTKCDDWIIAVVEARGIFAGGGRRDKLVPSVQTAVAS